MKRFTIQLACMVLASTLACSAASAATPSRHNSNSYTDQYGVLTDRNIFLKDRLHPPTQPSVTSGASTTQPSRFAVPEQTVVVRGVVFEDKAYHAYVENMSTGLVSRVSTGDPIGRGKAGEIDLNGLWYEGPSARTWVEIGCDLTGQEAAPPPPDEIPVATTQATTMPTGVEGLNINDPTLTQEQKMKLKRLMELKGKQ